MSRTCISCGMPMTIPEDHAAGDIAREYCRHCATENGDMASFEDTSRRLAERVQQTTKVSEADALRTVVERLIELPAWRGRS